MAEDRGPVFLLVCFLCFGTITSSGWMAFVAEGYKANSFLWFGDKPNGDSTIKKRNTTATWCIAKPSTSPEKLDEIIDYCCTQPGVDCRVIQTGGMCYMPSNKISAASVVMNIFYTLNGKHNFSCDFKGSALVVANDPSVGKCIYKA